MITLALIPGGDWPCWPYPVWRCHKPSINFTLYQPHLRRRIRHHVYFASESLTWHHYITSNVLLLLVRYLGGLVCLSRAFSLSVVFKKVITKPPKMAGFSTILIFQKGSNKSRMRIGKQVDFELISVCAPNRYWCPYSLATMRFM